MRIGDRYYFFNERLEVSFYLYVDDSVDKRLKSIGNFFKSEEDCKKAIEKIKSILK